MPIARASMPIVTPGLSHDDARLPPREHGRIRRLQPRSECGSAITQSDLSTPHGRMMATILAGLATFERELIQERIRSGMAAEGPWQTSRSPTRTAAEVRSPRAEGPRPGRPKAQLPPDRSRTWAEQEHRRRHRQTAPLRRRPRALTALMFQLCPLGVNLCPFYRVTPERGDRAPPDRACRGCGCRWECG